MTENIIFSLKKKKKKTEAWNITVKQDIVTGNGLNNRLQICQISRCLKFSKLQYFPNFKIDEIFQNFHK